MAIVGVVIILLGAFGLIVPFVGPLFDFGMGPEPAWVITMSRVVRHVLPGVAVILGGLMLFSGSRVYRGVGITLAILGGIWPRWRRWCWGGCRVGEPPQKGRRHTPPRRGGL